MGRNPKEFDLDQLEQLIGIGCTDEEIAAFFRTTPRTLQEKRKLPQYKEVFETARARMRVSLRRAQWRTAFAGNGNVTMQIWLGKVMLGQKEEIRHSGDAENPIEIDNKIEIVLVDPKPQPDTIEIKENVD